MSTDPELVRELKLDLERLHAEVEDLRGKLKKQTSETAKGVMNSSLSAVAPPPSRESR